MNRIEKRDEFLAAEVKELVLEIGYAECKVVETATDKIVVEAILDEENADRYSCTLADGVLKVDASKANKTISLTDTKKSAWEKQELTITVPYDMELEDLELCVGAGTAKLENVSTKYDKAKIEVGAGKLDVMTLTVANHIHAELGAGAVDIQNMTAKTANVECGVGRMVVKGAVESDIKAECGVGSLEMQLDAVESDYNYDIDCGLGSVLINGSKRGGWFASKADMVNAGAKGNMKLECGIGRIELVTQKRISAEA